MTRINRLIALARPLSAASATLSDPERSLQWPISTHELQALWSMAHDRLLSQSPRPPAPVPPPAQSAPPIALHLTSLPFSIPASAQIQGTYNHGTLHLQSSEPVRVSLFASSWLPTPVDVLVDEITLPRSTPGDLRGWLTVRDNPLVSLGWMPNRLMQRLGTGPAMMQQIWSALAPAPIHGKPPIKPPSRWSLRAEGVEGALRLHISNAQWPGVNATLDQTVDLHSNGDIKAGAGALHYRGPAARLIQFVEGQLLPLAGLPLGEGLPMERQRRTSYVVADVAWGPSEQSPDNFTVHATVAGNQWTAQATFERCYASNGSHQGDLLKLNAQGNLADLTGGGLLQAAAASSHATFMAPILQSAHSTAHQWIAPAAWPTAAASLCLRGQSKGERWNGSMQLHATHENWFDTVYGRIQSGRASSTPPTLAWSEPAAELEPFEFSAEPLGPALRAAHGVARLATGSRFNIDSQMLHDFGIVAKDVNATFTVQRQVLATAPPWIGAMPHAVWHSVHNLFRRPPSRH